MGEPVVERSNFYTPVYVARDIDNDGIPEMVVMHGGDPFRSPIEKSRLSARIMVISSKKGNKIN